MQTVVVAPWVLEVDALATAEAYAACLRARRSCAAVPTAETGLRYVMPSFLRRSPPCSRRWASIAQRRPHSPSTKAVKSLRTGISIGVTACSLAASVRGTAATPQHLTAIGAPQSLCQPSTRSSSASLHTFSGHAPTTFLSWQSGRSSWSSKFKHRGALHMPKPALDLTRAGRLSCLAQASELRRWTDVTTQPRPR